MEKPNIFLLVMDTARAGNFSLYGYNRLTDPNISEIAEEGFKVENCYANSIWTLPSHVSIFTGKLPSHHGVISKEDSLPNSKLLPEFLSEKGYRTIGISSNGFLSPSFGFDKIFDEFEFIGRSVSLEDELLFPEDKLFEELAEKEEDFWNNKMEKYLYLLKESFKQLSPKTIVNGAYYLIKKRLVEKRPDDGAYKANKELIRRIKGEEPIFGFINYVEPHDPYTPPEPIANDFLDKEFDEAMKISNEAYLIDYLREEQDSESEVLEDLYDAEIRYLDSKIGELADTIEEKTDRKTVIIITSDHGENFGEQGLWGHYGKITENLIHVPLIIKGVDSINIENNFSLRHLNKFIKGLAQGRTDFENSKRVVTEYYGLDSHNWDLDREGLSDIFFENQKSVIEEDLFLWTESGFTDRSDAEELKKYIELRCGNP